MQRVALAVLACLPLHAAWFRGNTHAHTNLSDGQDRTPVTGSNQHRAWMQPVMIAQAQQAPQTRPIPTVASPPPPTTPLSAARRPTAPDGPARAWAGTIKLRTWDEGPADPNPQYPVFNV